MGSKCSGLSSKSLAIIVAASVVGAVASLFIGFVIWWWFFVRSSSGKGKTYGFGNGGGFKGDSSWVKLLRSNKLIQVSLFQTNCQS